MSQKYYLVWEACIQFSYRNPQKSQNYNKSNNLSNSKKNFNNRYKPGSLGSLKNNLVLLTFIIKLFLFQFISLFMYACFVPFISLFFSTYVLTYKLTFSTLKIFLSKWIIGLFVYWYHNRLWCEKYITHHLWSIDTLMRHMLRKTRYFSTVFWKLCETNTSKHKQKISYAF